MLYAPNATSVAGAAPLPHGARIYLEGVDVTDLCEVADVAGGWAQCFDRHRNRAGVMAKVPGSEHRRTGKVVIRGMRSSAVGGAASTQTP